MILNLHLRATWVKNKSFIIGVLVHLRSSDENAQIKIHKRIIFQTFIHYLVGHVIKSYEARRASHEICQITYQSSSYPGELFFTCCLFLIFMCKTTCITHKYKHHSSRKLLSLVFFFSKPFEKHVFSISFTKRAGNLISKY